MKSTKPATFTCCEGRHWDVELPPSTAGRIRRRTGITEKKLLSAGFSDTWHDEVQPLLEAVWIACCRQALDRGLDEQGFYQAISGRITQAVAALIQAFSNAAPVHDNREFLAALAECLRVGTDKPMLGFIERQAAKVGQDLAEAAANG